MTRDEARRALEDLAAAPAAKWIGNKLVDGGTRLLQKCMRCGAEQVLKMPTTAVTALQSGSHGNDLARQVPPNFDEKLYAWKRAFQREHEGCTEGGIAA